MTGAPDTAQEELLLHASCVAVAGAGVLILGPSGCGKSALALWLMAFGAELVVDDYTLIRRAGDSLHARAPERISGLIEAREVGILCATPRESAELVLIVDLGPQETQRLPPTRRRALLGVELPLLYGSRAPHFAPAVLQYIKGGVLSEMRIPHDPA